MDNSLMTQNGETSSEGLQNGSVSEESRTRTPNWSDEEKSLLIEEVAKRVDQLSAPRSRTNSIQKESVWEEVSQALNAAKVGPWRSAQTCRKKFENLKILARRAQKQVIEEQISRGINVNNNDIPPDDDLRATVDLLRAYQAKSTQETPNSIEAVIAAMQEHANQLSMENLQQLLALRGAAEAENEDALSTAASSEPQDEDPTNLSMNNHKDDKSPLKGDNPTSSQENVLKEQLSSPPKNAVPSVSSLPALSLTLKNSDISLTPVTNGGTSASSKIFNGAHKNEKLSRGESSSEHGKISNSIHLGAGITLTPAAPVKLSSSVTLTAVPPGTANDGPAPPTAAYPTSSLPANNSNSAIMITPLSQHSKQIVVDLPAMRRSQNSAHTSHRGPGRPPSISASNFERSYSNALAQQSKMAMSSRSSGGNFGGYSSSGATNSSLTSGTSGLAALGMSMMNLTSMMQNAAALSAAASQAGSGKHHPASSSSSQRGSPSPPPAHRGSNNNSPRTAAVGNASSASAVDALSRAAAETLMKRKRKIAHDEEEFLLHARKDMYQQMTRMADDVKEMLETVRATESLKQRVLEEKVELLKLQRQHMQLLMSNGSNN